jgi:hypothetical protein
MRPFLAAALLVAAATACPAADGNAAADLPLVLKFVKDHVVGRTVVSPMKTYAFDDGRIETDYEDTTSYSQLTDMDRAFSFDMTIVKKYTRYDVKDGKRVLPGVVRNIAEVSRYEFGERVSTGRLTGVLRLLSTTRPSDAATDHGTVTLVTGVRLTDGRLSWRETVPGYMDIIAAGGKYKPYSTEGESVMTVVSGRLRLAVEVKLYDVDPDTLARTAMKDKPIQYLAEQPEKKPER